MIELLPNRSDQIVGFKLSGILHDTDYETFVPAVEAGLKEGKHRMLAWFHDFRGWDLSAAWEDFKFDVTHYTSFDRIALVGEKSWEKWMSMICKPFTTAKVKYFDATEIETAWAWLQE